MTPVIGVGGTGVTTKIGTRDRFDVAWNVVSAATKGEILLEEFIPGFDHRFLVIGDRVRAVLRERPLHVLGDGSSTVHDLLERRRVERQLNPFTRRQPFELDHSVHQAMAEAGVGLTSVLAAGAFLQLDTVGNLRRGAHSEDVPIEDVHPGFLEAAVDAKNCVDGVRFCGIDILAADIARPPKSQPWAVCEVNTNPDFAMHLFPGIGSARDVPVMLFGYLFDP